jgi:hypothetical protein
MALVHSSGVFRIVKPLYSGAKAGGREALSAGSNILTDILNKDPEQSVGTIFKKRFGEAKGNLQQKIKNDRQRSYFKKETQV